MQPIKRVGQFIGPADLLEWLDGAAPLGRIRSWQDSVAPASRAKITAAARGASAVLESVYDAQHGRRYLCFAYRTREERAACWAFLTAPGA